MSEVILDVSLVDVTLADAPILRQVSLQVRRGEIVSVIGPNGAGKSTLLNTIVGFHSPSRGSIIFEGRSIHGLPPELVVQRGVTLVPEAARVFSEMTVLDNLKMGAYPKSARAFLEESLHQVFDYFPLLRERLRQKAGTLSGGERQMLAIGRALMSRPKLLLLDEPSLGLAPLVVERLFETIRCIAETGITVLLVEQNVYLSLALSQRTYVLENGGIVMQGASSELLAADHVQKFYLAL